MDGQPKRITVSTLKSRCLSVIDGVVKSREPIIVTKRGRPVAKLVPAERSRKTNLRGSVKFHGNIVEPVLGDWDIDK